MAKKAILLTVIIVCMAALVYLSVSEGPEPPPPPLAISGGGSKLPSGHPPTSGRAAGEKIMAPDFTLERLNGGRANLKSLRGKVVLINFWSSSCPPCIMEMPAIEKLYQIMQGKPFEILAITTDPRKTAEKVVGRMNLSFPVLLDTEAEVARAFGTYLLPETFIIAPDGTVDNKIMGAANWGDGSVIDYMNNLIKSHQSKGGQEPAEPETPPHTSP